MICAHCKHDVIPWLERGRYFKCPGCGEINIVQTHWSDSDPFTGVLRGEVKRVDAKTGTVTFAHTPDAEVVGYAKNVKPQGDDGFSYEFEVGPESPNFE